MINLKIHRYCNNCPDFEAEQTTDIMRTYEGEIIGAQHDICCKHYQKCNAIYNYLYERGYEN